MRCGPGRSGRWSEAGGGGRKADPAAVAALAMRWMQGPSASVPLPEAEGPSPGRNGGRRTAKAGELHPFPTESCPPFLFPRARSSSFSPSPPQAPLHLRLVTSSPVFGPCVRVMIPRILQVQRDTCARAARWS